MKPGVRALGIAESYREESATERAGSEATREQTSTLAGAVLRATRVVDGLVFETCSVGGSDATAAVCRLVDRLDREDVRYLLIAGIAPAWFNVLDLHQIHEETDLPVLSVTFEESSGLESAIREAFDDDATARDRLDTYREQPRRRRLDVDGETLFLRHVGIDESEARDVVRGFTPEGGRPDPLRVARLAARAGDEFRHE